MQVVGPSVLRVSWTDLAPVVLHFVINVAMLVAPSGVPPPDQVYGPDVPPEAVRLVSRLTGHSCVLGLHRSELITVTGAGVADVDRGM